MGASRGNATPRLVDESPWPLEEAGEEAVLAEFAEEPTVGARAALAAVAPIAAAVVVPVGPVEVLPAAPGMRAGIAGSRLRDLARTLALGCLSAMALGASFAIGFGYIWSDRAALVTTAEPAVTSESAPRPYMPGWWLPLPQLVPPAKATKAPAPPPKPIEPSALRATAPAKARKVSPAPPTRAAASATNPNTRGASAVAEEGEAAPPSVSTPDVASTSTPVSDDKTLLPSRAMLSSESAPTREWMVSSESHSAVKPALRVAAAATIPPPASPVSASRADVDAVRHTIALYQSAYSQMDVGAMAVVWPSLDTVSVERAFASVDRQALTLHECRVTTAGNLATAVCPGQVRYVGRIGGRQLQERQGTWTIALERRGEAWEFVRLNVR